MTPPGAMPPQPLLVSPCQSLQVHWTPSAGTFADRDNGTSSCSPFVSIDRLMELELGMSEPLPALGLGVPLVATDCAHTMPYMRHTGRKLSATCTQKQQSPCVMAAHWRVGISSPPPAQPQTDSPTGPIGCHAEAGIEGC
jgi:hypothetical protein